MCLYPVRSIIALASGDLKQNKKKSECKQQCKSQGPGVTATLVVGTCMLCSAVVLSRAELGIFSTDG